MGLIGKNNEKYASSMFNKKELKSGDLLVSKDNRCMLYISDKDWREKYKMLCGGPDKYHEGLAVMPNSLRVESQTYVDIPSRFDEHLKCEQYPNLTIVKIYKEQIEVSKRDMNDWYIIVREFKSFIKAHGYEAH